MQNTIHFALQAKGGIGKSFVSALLAQYLLQETGAVPGGSKTATACQ